ncbi:protein kinase [Angomonas deanei]|nr:protein kinase [Angomonas deanei]|eukprot:EPY29405.1 protein kinase [Angomonas deanei]
MSTLFIFFFFRRCLFHGTVVCIFIHLIFYSLSSPLVLVGPMNAFFNADRTLFTPGAKWKESSESSVCQGCQTTVMKFMSRHHCRWCGGLFCDACAPRTREYNNGVYRCCRECRLPLIFRIVYNPLTRKHDCNACNIILSFLDDRDKTALLQSCQVMMTYFPVPDIPVCYNVYDRFPSFYFGAKIGSGGYGVVFKCRDNQHPERGRVAIKVFYKSAVLSFVTWRQVLYEIDLMKGNDHSNIVQLYEVFQTDTFVALVMEAGHGGKIRQALRVIEEHNLPLEPFVANVCLQVAKGMQYLWSRHIVHGDVKLDNIVLSEDYSRVILIDFGISRKVEPFEKKNYTIRGSLYYIAPELLAALSVGQASIYCTGEDLSVADVFSLGVVAYRMLTGKSPFTCGDVHGQYAHTRTGFDFSDRLWGHRSMQARAFTQRLMAVNPSKRGDWSGIVDSNFITQKTRAMPELLKLRQEIIADNEAELKEWSTIEDTAVSPHTVMCRRTFFSPFSFFK